MAIGVLLYISSASAQTAPTPAFQDGQAARLDWEKWIGSASGDYRVGAEYWAGQRSKRIPGSCFGADGQILGDITAGCRAAQDKLAAIDVRRKAEPEYRAGFNTYIPPSEAAKGQLQAVVPAPIPYVPPVSSSPTINAFYTGRDVLMLLTHDDPNEFVEKFMGKSFSSPAKFALFERLPTTASAFMVSVITSGGQVSCIYDKQSHVTSLPFIEGQQVVISGKLGMALKDVVMLEANCVVRADG